MKEKLNKKQLEEKPLAYEEYEYATIPPDGGFGWVVALAAMVMRFSLIGIYFIGLFSFVILFVMERYLLLVQ
jgi:hypothetical protein